MTALVKYDAACKLLAEARRIDEVKDIRDKAVAMQVYAKRARNTKLIADATAIKKRAERRLGEMMEEIRQAGKLAKPPGGSKKRPRKDRVFKKPDPSLATQGIDKNLADRARKAAALPAKDFEESVERAVKRVVAAAEVKGVTGSAATKAHRAAVAAAAKAGGVTEAPKAKVRVVYADPSWDYGAHSQPDYQTDPRDHYPPMTLEEICDLPVKDWVEDDAVLFLWVTSPMLRKSFEVVDAWGFEYKASFVWNKIKHNMGHYNSVRHEFLLVCTRGSCKPDVKKLINSVQSIERGKHSQKPAEFYEIIETLYTHGRKLEMFARCKREGWEHWGHNIDLLEAAE